MVKRPNVYGGIGTLPDSETFKGRSGKPGVLFRRNLTDREITRIEKSERRLSADQRRAKILKGLVFIPFKNFRRIK